MKKPNIHSSSILWGIMLIFLLFFSNCSKKEKINYGALGLIEGIEILDIEPFEDTLLLVAGKNKDNQGSIFVYNITSKKYTTTPTNQVMYDIVATDSKIWACGDSMSILTSTDKGKTWNTYNSFSYFWEADKSDFRKLFIHNNTPIYAIGEQNMLEGNVYITTNNSLYPFTSIQMQAGVNDMTIVDSTQAFIAAYGSIIRFSNNGTIKKYEDIGGYNFTSISYSGENTIYSTTYDGKIFTYSLTDSVWKKSVDTRFELRHIAGDSYGNVIAIGKSNTIYISNDFGQHWHVERYSFGRDVTSLQFTNNMFYIGCKSGEIHTITRKQLE